MPVKKENEADRWAVVMATTNVLLAIGLGIAVFAACVLVVFIAGDWNG